MPDPAGPPHSLFGHALALAALALAAAPGAGCAPSPERVFERAVVPILEARCLDARCHGVLPDAEARGEVIDWEYFNVRILPDGRVADVGQAYERALSRVNTAERAELSTLLRKPLGSGPGGLPHMGGAVFASTDDAAWRVVRDWAASETGGGEGAPSSSLPANEQLFGATVLHELAALQCLNAGCHGELAPFTAFEGPVIVDGDVVFSTEAIHKNHHAARMHLFLGGDPLLSRLVRKGLPLDRGGIVHRGGNDIFFNRGTAEDPAADRAVESIVAWANVERALALGTSELPEVSAIVFVRGPAAAEEAFRHDGFFPGTDLWVLEPPGPGGTLRNLTAGAHPGGPADVRDPAVSHDGTRVAFSMRTGLDDAFNVYEIGLDGTGLRALTADAAALPGGGVAANVQPTWGPDGRVWFVSTRAGHVADAAGTLDSEIWAVDRSTLALERWTHDPSPEVTPAFFGVGKSYGTLGFTVLRNVGGRHEGAVFRTPLDHNRAYHGDPELHIHHGITLEEEVAYGMRVMADGRFVATLMDRTNVWRGGRLAILDRQMGPEIPAGREDEAAVGGYRHAFRVLDEAAAASGLSSGGLYRDPAPLPDGRLLVAWAAGPLDLDDPAAAPELGLYAVTLEEDRATGGPVIAALTPLLDEPGVGEWDPEPVVRRPLEDDPTHEADWDSTRTETTGRIAYRHVETLEGIMSNLSPLGARPLRDDLVYARFVESVPVTPDELALGPISAGVHGRTRILAEVPLAGGSFSCEVPADVPFRVQLLNADRMAVGAQHNRWVSVAPGEKFPGGVSPELYPALCAGCHGSLSGDRADVGGPVPDAVTGASVTLATYAGYDPRRPLDPVPVGAERIEIDFRRDVRPLLERSCTSCHAGADPAGGLDLVPVATASFDSAYEALLRPVDRLGGRAYVEEAGSSAFESPLVERIYGRELGAPGTVTGACPGAPALTGEERLVIVRWIDLGAVYRGVAP